MPLPVLSASSRAHTDPEDAAKAALSFKLQQEYAESVHQLSKLRSVAKRAKVMEQVAESGSDAERETREDTILNEAALNSISQRRAMAKPHRAKKAGGGPTTAKRSDDGDTVTVTRILSPPTASTSGLHAEADGTASAPSESVQDATPLLVADNDGQTPPENASAPKNTGAVMVTLSTTQATIFVVAALSTAALVGAFLLWLTLAFELYDRILQLIYSPPPLRQQLMVAYYELRRQIYHEVEIYLAAMIIRLEILRESAILAQGLDVI